MITITDFNAVVRDGYTADQIASIEAFIAEYGDGYDTMSDLLADWSATH